MFVLQEKDTTQQFYTKKIMRIVVLSKLSHCNTEFEVP